MPLLQHMEVEVKVRNKAMKQLSLRTLEAAWHTTQPSHLFNLSADLKRSQQSLRSVRQLKPWSLELPATLGLCYSHMQSCLQSQKKPFKQTQTDKQMHQLPKAGWTNWASAKQACKAVMAVRE